MVSGHTKNHTFLRAFIVSHEIHGMVKIFMKKVLQRQKFCAILTKVVIIRCFAKSMPFRKSGYKRKYGFTARDLFGH